MPNNVEQAKEPTIGDYADWIAEVQPMAELWPKPGTVDELVLIIGGLS